MRNLFLIAFAFLFSFAINGQDIPKPTLPANDYANILQPSELASLNKVLIDYQDSTTNQIAICIEKSLNGRDEFSRSLAIARAWGIGEAGKNNGVLIYLSIDDRKAFIQSADKTQGVLTDYITRLIIEKSLVPELKQGNYYQGLLNTVESIQQVLAGEFDNTKAKKPRSVLSIIIFFIVIVIVMSLLSRGNKNNGGGINRGGVYPFPFPMMGGGGFGGGGGGGSSWGGFGGGGGFNGGGAGGSW